MNITDETVEHVAKLARLELSPEEVTRYSQELSKILDLMDQLNALDLSTVDTSLDTDAPVVLREDDAARTLDREAILQLAPSEEEGFFRVPKILDAG